MRCRNIHECVLLVKVNARRKEKKPNNVNIQDTLYYFSYFYYLFNIVWVNQKVGAGMIIVIVIAAVAAFFLYRRWKQGTPVGKLKSFADPVSQETGKQLDVLSPITKKAIAGQARAYYAGATY